MEEVGVSHEATTKVEDTKQGVLIAVAAYSCLTVTLLQSLVVPAIPLFPDLLDASSTTVSWTITATLLAGAIATPVIGRLGDLLPRRPIMVATMLCVLVGSIIAPLGSVPAVIIGRALQGIGTALIPVAMAEMRHRLGPRQMMGALALLSAMLGIGGGLGIPLGGVILSWLGWKAMFWFAAVMSAISVALIVGFVPADHSDHKGRFDVPGAVLLGVGLTAALTAISQGALWGWGNWRTVTLFLVGIVIIVLWGIYELRQSSPLVNVRTMANRPVLLVNAASLLLGLLMFTNLLLTTLELQNPVEHGGFGWSATGAGLAMLPSAVLMLAVAPISARIADAFGPRAVIAAGAAITTLGYVLRLVAAPNGTAVLIWATVVSVGVGIGYAGLPMMLVTLVHAHETGSANAVNALMRSIGMATASAAVAACTAALAAQFEGGTVPSATALTVLAAMGIALGVIAFVLSINAKDKAPHEVHEIDVPPEPDVVPAS